MPEETIKSNLSEKRNEFKNRIVRRGLQIFISSYLGMLAGVLLYWKASTRYFFDVKGKPPEKVQEIRQRYSNRIKLSTGIIAGSSLAGIVAQTIYSRSVKKEIEALENIPLILAVDDDKSIREAYEQHFSLIGYEIMTAVNGAQGLELAVSRHPDLIVTDNRMPVMTGYEMAKELRSNPKTRDIPIVGCGDFSAEQQEILDYFVEKGSGANISGLVKKILGEPNA